MQLAGAPTRHPRCEDVLAGGLVSTALTPVRGDVDSPHSGFSMRSELTALAATYPQVANRQSKDRGRLR
jgi:hypothetical protein